MHLSNAPDNPSFPQSVFHFETERRPAPALTGFLSDLRDATGRPMQNQEDPTVSDAHKSQPHPPMQRWHAFRTTARSQDRTRITADVLNLETRISQRMGSFDSQTLACVLFLLPYLLNDSQMIRSTIHFSKPLLCVMLICSDWSISLI